ncbi:MAG: flagellar biosynthetic protein FliO [Gemmatimonadaceae bacterium]
MSAPSFLMVMAMLAVVLGAMGIALRVLRRYTLAGASRKDGVKMEVIQRLTLGQRQGIAVVRIGSRVLAVSMGDGGVHQVADLTETDIASSATNAAPAPGSAPMHAIADGIRKLALIRNTEPPDEPAAARSAKKNGKRISYVAPIEDFQAVLSMAMAGGARA